MVKGRIELLTSKHVSLLPRVSYLPPDTLSDVLHYPANGSEPDDVEFAKALGAVGLEWLVSSLDRTAAWNEELNCDELRLIAFARLRPHKPDWVIVDEVLDTLDSAAHARIRAISRRRSR